MNEFTKIERSFWETDEARDMTPEEKYFWLYLRTNANVNTLGCYPFRMRRAMDETGYNRETLEKLLARIEDCGYIRYSADTGEVWLLAWGTENWTRKSSVLRALRSDLQNVKSKAFREDLTALLQEGGFLGSAEEEEPETATEEQAGTMGTAGEQAGTMGTAGEQPGTNGAEKEKEKEKENKTFSSALSPEMFAAFWEAYPNRKNKQAAIKAWKKLKVTPSKHFAIMAGLERAKASMEWAKDGGEFIPYPATWLNAGGWENEYKPLHPQAPPTPPQTPPENDPLERRRRLAEGSE